MKRFVGGRRRGNCWIGCLLLLLTGRLRALILCWRWPFPPHAMGITWRGNIIHFQSLKNSDVRPPWYFQGRMQVFKPELFNHTETKYSVIAWTSTSLPLSTVSDTVSSA
jgi:hypothetical protein